MARNNKTKWIIGGVLTAAVVVTAVIMTNPQLQKGYLGGLGQMPAVTQNIRPNVNVNLNQPILPTCSSGRDFTIERVSDGVVGPVMGEREMATTVSARFSITPRNCKIPVQHLQFRWESFDGVGTISTGRGEFAYNGSNQHQYINIGDAWVNLYQGSNDAVRAHYFQQDNSRVCPANLLTPPAFWVRTNSASPILTPSSRGIFDVTLAIFPTIKNNNGRTDAFYKLNLKAINDIDTEEQFLWPAFPVFIFDHNMRESNSFRGDC